MWGEKTVKDLRPDETGLSTTGKTRKQQVMRLLQAAWQNEKTAVNHYPAISQAKKVSAVSEPFSIDKKNLGLGQCPVASPRTLCCNLQTLDAVDNCGYGCSYCSIQSFFDGKQIRFDNHFTDKLDKLDLDPEQTYHIGTGQSSDSLMWGNSHGVLDSLIAFARANPNVILELKTKSANIGHLLKSKPLPNLLCTWSLNTATIIEHEEHGTAPLQKRLTAATKLADAGYRVGFHFHPIVHYDHWYRDYSAIVEQLVERFKPSDVVLISMGTLTFIKSVIREIRKRSIPGQILKMPMIDADGKLSYPDDIKLELFTGLYDAFPVTWKEQVFFYLCMENQRFWEPVFGYAYESNDAFEKAMKAAYLNKCIPLNSQYVDHS